MPPKKPAILESGKSLKIRGCAEERNEENVIGESEDENTNLLIQYRSLLKIDPNSEIDILYLEELFESGKTIRSRFKHS